MTGEIGTLMGLAHSLLLLTYIFGVLMQTLPVPKRDWKAWGPTMMWDACIGELALGMLSAVQLAVGAISDLLGASLSGPFTSPTVSFGLIMAQLAMIDTAIFLISAVSATVVLGPVAEILARMLGPCASWLTSAIILWSTLILIINLFPRIWLTIYTLGICFFAIPFRIGRQIGSYLMSTSIVLAIGLPPMPSIALWLEGYLGYQGFLKPFQEIITQVQSNPLLIAQLLASIPSAVGSLMAAIVIALIVFPVIYLFFLTVIARSLAKLLGGSSGGPTLTRFILAS